jgi:hypothetical protein
MIKPKIKFIVTAFVLYTMSLSAHSETFLERFQSAYGLSFKPFAVLTTFISETHKNLSSAPYYGSASTNSYAAVRYLQHKVKTNK